MVNVRDQRQRIEQAGADVAIVTMGSAAQAADFRSRYELPFVCLSDPQRRAYAAYGLERGSLWQLAGPRVWRLGLKSLWRHGVGVPVGDPLQMPGLFVVDRHGVIRYAHRPRHQADLPALGDVIARLVGIADGETVGK